MADANMKKAKTGRSGLGLVILGVAIITLIVAAVWILTQPGVLSTVLNVVILAVAVIVAIMAIVYAVIAIVAVPVYVAKGEQYQEGVDYDLDDVEPVTESSSDDPKNGTA